MRSPKCTQRTAKLPPFLTLPNVFMWERSIRVANCCRFTELMRRVSKIIVCDPNVVKLLSYIVLFVMPSTTGTESGTVDRASEVIVGRTQVNKDTNTLLQGVVLTECGLVSPSQHCRVDSDRCFYC